MTLRYWCIALSGWVGTIHTATPTGSGAEVGRKRIGCGEWRRDVERFLTGRYMLRHGWQLHVSSCLHHG